MSFTENQDRALAIIPKFTGIFSFLGSASIIYEIIRDQTKWRRPYHRLLFSMCVFDAFSSVALALSTWPIPGDSTRYGASGSVATCSAQAFFIQANIASPIYNFMLSLYFLLVIKHNLKESQLRKQVEPIMQAITIAFALGTSFASLGMGLFNDSNMWCWLNAAPKGCQQSYKYDETTCTRGDNAEIFRWAFFFVPLWIAALGSMILMALLYIAVNKQEKASSRYEFPPSSALVADDIDQNVESDGQFSLRNLMSQSMRLSMQSVFQASSEEQMSLRERQKQRRNRKRSQAVAWQAARFLAVFWLTWLAGSCNRLLQLLWGRSYFWLMVLHSIFTPLQGFFNFLVYKYPQFYNWRSNRRKSPRTAQAPAQQNSQTSHVGMTTALGNGDSDLFGEDIASPTTNRLNAEEGMTTVVMNEIKAIPEDYAT